MDVKHQNDYNLVHQYLLGNKSAGEQLYIPSIPLLEKYIYKKTKGSALSSHDKEDIIAEVLKISITNLNRFSGKSSFLTYLCGIANNAIKQAYSKYSKTAKHVSVESVIEEDQEVEVFNAIELYQPGRNLLSIVILKEQVAVLEKAFSTLKPDYQQIIQMRLINKVPVKQVAILTGRTEDSIDALYRRALKKYKENYEQLYSSQATEKTQTHDKLMKGGCD